MSWLTNTAKKVVNKLDAVVEVGKFIPGVSLLANYADKGLDVVSGVLNNVANKSTESAKKVAEVKQAVVTKVGTGATNTSITTNKDTTVSVPQPSKIGGMWDKVVDWYSSQRPLVKWLLGGVLLMFVWWLFIGRKKRRSAPKRRKSFGGNNYTRPKRRSAKKSTSKSDFVKRMAAGRKKAAKKRRRA